jgi:hypothetical protein
MKIPYDDQKKLSIFVMLLILCSFSLSLCSPDDLIGLDKLNRLIQLRKDSKNQLEKEIEDMKLKYEPRIGKIKESVTNREKNQRVYENLSKEIENIKKIFLNYTSSIEKGENKINF